MNTVKCFFSTSNQSTAISAGLLILRVVAGLAFIYHGWGKIQNPMAWMGPDAPVPGFLQLLAAVAEFGGGAAWILGLLTRLASLGIMFTMVVAVLTHAVMLKDPFVNMTMAPGSSYEPAAIYLAVSILFLTIGAGKFSLDRLFFKDTLS